MFRSRERRFMKMKTNNPTQAERRWDAAALDELIDEFTVEAAGDDERILAFLQALEKHVALPCDGFVIGEPVSVQARACGHRFKPGYEAGLTAVGANMVNGCTDRRAIGTVFPSAISQSVYPVPGE